MRRRAPNRFRADLERAARIGAAPFPLGRHLGMRLKALEPGRAVVEMPLSARTRNPLGVVHGGVVFLLLDTCMGFAATSRLEGLTSVATTDVAIQFLRPVSRGRLTGEARVVIAGRQLYRLEGTVRDEKGRTVASALATAVVQRKRNPKR